MPEGSYALGFPASSLDSGRRTRSASVIVCAPKAELRLPLPRPRRKPGTAQLARWEGDNERERGRIYA
eukprot:scaffold599_cov282-Pinguiococcus_pyrenoidosus.AAC.5